MITLERRASNRTRIHFYMILHNYMRYGFGTTHEEEDVCLDGQVVPRKNIFRYLG